MTWWATCGLQYAHLTNLPTCVATRAPRAPPLLPRASKNSRLRQRSQVNLIAAALYHVYVKFIIGELNLSTMDMVLYNNAMSIPLLVVLGLLLDK